MNIQPLKLGLCAMSFLFFLISCAPEVGRQIMTGRTALMNGNSKAALPKFEAISQSNPNYIYCINLFCVGIWTYLGRTYHEIGDNYKAIKGEVAIAVTNLREFIAVL